jgi:hypothetical protein
MNGNEWEEHREHLTKCMREIQGTYENCKNSLIWRQGKKDTVAGHMENTLKTNWERMGKYVCKRSTNVNSIVDIWGSMCE